MKKKNTKKKQKIAVMSYVREVMESKNITGYKMAIDLDIPNQFIYSYLMKPDYAPNVVTALILSEYLNTPITKLFKINKQ
jgi:DNA-binding XRE family transcriptional regulator